MRLVSRDELAKHNRREDAWIAVDGVVYNITPHIMNHPGWKDGPVTTVVAIMTYVGKDATRAWHEVGVHSTQKAQAELRTYAIGVLDDADEQVARRYELQTRRRRPGTPTATTRSPKSAWQHSLALSAAAALLAAATALGLKGPLMCSR